LQLLVEQLFNSVQDAQRRSDEASRIVSETRHHVKDKEALHRVLLKEIQLQSGPMLRTLREHCEQLEEEFRRCERQSDEELRANEKQHSAELADMDRRAARTSGPIRTSSTALCMHQMTETHKCLQLYGL
jgi:hypothetical protein